VLINAHTPHELFSWQCSYFLRTHFWNLLHNPEPLFLFGSASEVISFNTFLWAFCSSSAWPFCSGSAWPFCSGSVCAKRTVSVQKCVQLWAQKERNLLSAGRFLYYKCPSFWLIKCSAFRMSSIHTKCSVCAAREMNQSKFKLIKKLLSLFSRPRTLVKIMLSSYFRWRHGYTLTGLLY
jgi:hypothetical protein